MKRATVGLYPLNSEDSRSLVAVDCHAPCPPQDQSAGIHTEVAGNNLFSGSIVTMYAPSAPMRRFGPKVIFGINPVSNS
jgi:hypothetical protein